MFAKRSKPIPARRVSRQSPSPDGEDGAPPAASAASGRPPGARRALSMDEEEESCAFKVKKAQAPGASAPTASAKPPSARRALSMDEEETRAFKVKKSKLSRQMSKGLHSAGQAGGALRSRGGLADADLEADEAGDVVVMEPDVEMGTVGGEEAEQLAAAQEAEEEGEADMYSAASARLARSRRQAAREMYGSRADVPLEPGVDSELPANASYMPFGTGVKAGPSEAARKARELILAKDLPDDRELDPGAEGLDAWALQQMRVGAHRRRTGPAPAPRPAAKKPALAGGSAGIGHVGGAAMGSARSGGLQDSGAQKHMAKRVCGNSQESFQDSTPGALGAEGAKPLPTPSVAMAQLWDAARKLEGGADERASRAGAIEEQRRAAQDQLREVENRERQLDRELRAAQELSELATSLGGLLDAKAPKLKQALQTLGQIESDFVSKRAERRARELRRALRAHGATLSAPEAAQAGADDEVGPAPDIAGAEQRRERRRAQREAQGGKRPLEGWDTSSASEEDGVAETLQDRSAFCTAAHRQLLADVDAEFGDMRAVLRLLRASKERLKGEYSKAFVPQALPEVLGLYLGYSLLWWDPLRLCSGAAAGAKAPPQWGPAKPMSITELEGFDWFEDLAEFSELSGDDDPDKDLVPKLVQQCVFPEVSRRMSHCWDVSSEAQSRWVAALLDECLLFETDETATAFAGLLEAAYKRLEQGLASMAPEVFVEAKDLERWYSSEARWRLLRRSGKLARCALQLDGRLPDARLQQLVLSHVFERRMAPHLRAPRLDKEEMSIVERFVAALPDKWLEQGLPPALRPLRDVLGPRAPVGPQAATTSKAAVRVLIRMGCSDEAQALANSQ